MDPATHLRENRAYARACRNVGISDLRRHFVEYALYWRRVLRAERHHNPHHHPAGGR